MRAQWLTALSLLLAPSLRAQQPDVQSRVGIRSIAIDDRLASDARLSVGDTVMISSAAGATGESVVIGAITKRVADPSQISRSDYRIRMHLDQLQSLTGYGDRVDRFAVATRNGADVAAVQRAINASAFGFQAYRSRDIAIGTSKTFAVVSRFHRAIGIITIVASAIFLLCIMLLKVEERRRDVAALRLMGISSRSIVRSVVIEASLVAVLGSAMGVALGAISSAIVNVYYQGVYRTTLEFSIVTRETVAFAVALSLGLGIAAGLVASIRLVRTHPLELFGR